MEAKDRIIFAADVASLDDLKKYLQVFKGKVGAIKVGMELLTYALFTGEPIFKTILDESDLNIMWDLKYGDIPDTVKGAARVVAEYGQNRILGFTVHCSAGRKALQSAVQAVKNNFSGTNPPLVIGVTLLTSLGQQDLDDLGIKGSPEEVVLRWSDLAATEGAPALVCSPKETKMVLEQNPDFVVINPGIRFAGSSRDSQKRVTTPGMAISNGASYIVMGSDLRRGEPANNIQRAVVEVSTALASRGW